jgi:hypothetical protein
MTYKVRQWFLPALQKLAVQEHRLETEDVQRLGLEFSLKVAELRGKVQGFERAKEVPSGGGWIGSQAIPTAPVTEFIKELFPAAIVTSPGIDDPRSWDPVSLSVQPGLTSEAEILPTTPESMLDTATKEGPLLDGFTLNEPDPAFGRGPFVSSPWGLEPNTSLPPTCESSIGSLFRYCSLHPIALGKNVGRGGWKVKHRK